MRIPLDSYLHSIYQAILLMREGAVADYIPELAKTDPDQFGIAVVTVDGHVYAVGDAHAPFTIQSISKALVYGAALADHSRETVLERVGVEPSGEAFNSISLDPRTGAPRNPMINAGAIATTALINGADVDAQWARIIGFLSDCAGRTLDIDEAVYRSESETGFRNRAIAWMLRNFDKTQDDPMPCLENYFRQCSVRVTARDLAVMAATLATGGVNPVTNTQVMSETHVESVLSVMATCGMYDASGAWLYEIGMPAKSGVGGGIMAVLPGRLGIAVFSPRLDTKGNSVRGIATCRRLSQDLGLHVFGRRPRPELVLARVYNAAEAPSGRRRTQAQAQALSEEAEGIRILAIQGDVGLDGADYLIRQMDELAPGSTAMILDFNRVHHLAPVAARMMIDAARQLVDDGQPVVLARIPDSEGIADALLAAAGDTPLHTFQDLESATAWCENHLLAALDLGTGRYEEISLDRVPLFSGLATEDRVNLLRRSVSRRLAEGERLMIQGDNADDGVHLLVSGELDVCTLRSDGRLQRVATLVPGQLVGELALAGLRVRTATVIARGEVEVRSLSLASFKELVASNPRLDSTILSHLCIELAEKFTMANRLVTGLTQADAPAVGAIIERAKTSTYWRRAKARRDKIDPELVSVLAPE